PRRGDLAHVDATDPDRRARGEQVRAADRRVDRVVVGERQLLGEDEVGSDREQHDPDEARFDRRETALGPPHGSARLVLSVAFWITGAAPMTRRPERYRSFPASHSAGWPGAAVYGYGPECRKLSSTRFFCVGE